MKELDRQAINYKSAADGKRWRRFRERVKRKALAAWGAFWGLDLNSNFCRCGEFFEGNCDLKLSQSGGAVMTNRVVCGNSYICPWCAPAKRELLAGYIQRLLLSWATDGKQLAMMVLTARHTRSEAFADVFKDIRKCETKITQRLTLRGVEFVRVGDLTVGKNGFHPHSNILVAAPAGSDLAALRKEILKLWERSAKLEGRYVNVRDACRFIRLTCNDGHFTGISEYVAGVPHSSHTFSEHWSVGREFSRLDLKVMSRGRTPFELLDSNYNGDWKLWCEIAAVLKGARLFGLSAATKKRSKALGLDFKTIDDEPLVDEDVPLAAPLFRYSDDDVATRAAEITEAEIHIDCEIKIWRAETGDYGDLPRSKRDEIRKYLLDLGFVERSEHIDDTSWVVLPDGRSWKQNIKRSPAGCPWEAEGCW